jgi:hypothetical protein
MWHKDKKSGWGLPSSLYLKEAILNEKKKDWTKDAHICQLVLIPLMNWDHFLLQYFVCLYPNLGGYFLPPCIPPRDNLEWENNTEEPKTPIYASWFLFHRWTELIFSYNTSFVCIPSWLGTFFLLVYLQETILNEKKTLKNERRPYMPAGYYSTDDLSSFSPTILRLFVSKAGWVLSSSFVPPRQPEKKHWTKGVHICWFLFDWWTGLIFYYN